MSAPQEEIFVEGPPCNTFLKCEVPPESEPARLRAAVAAGLGLGRREGQRLAVGSTGTALSRQSGRGDRMKLVFSSSPCGVYGLGTWVTGIGRHG